MKDGNKSVATYLYCLIHAKEPPSLEGVPGGLPGTAPPRLLDAGESLWVVAAGAPLALYGKEPIDSGLQNLKWVSECAVAHERVVEFFTGAGTVIPMKLFTLFTTDARALAHLRSTRKHLNDVIARVADCREWGVRITFNEGRAAAARDGIKVSKGGSSPGTQFLLQKKKQQDFARELRALASEQAEKAYQQLVQYGRDSLRLATLQDENGGRVILDAAFLVPEEKRKRFQEAVSRLTSGGAVFDITLTGPWPPYNFIAKAK